VRLNDPFELPSLEEIKEMENKRSQAIESLEISGSGDSVKCQKCGIAVPIVGKSIKPKSNRIAILEKRVRWLENYPRGNNKRSSIYNNNNVKKLKQELTDLLAEDAKADKLRSLPL
jgi:hypothetical protein